MSDAVALAWHQYRLERRMFWRNPTAAFFNFLLPLLFLALFGAIFSGNQDDLNVLIPGIAGMSITSHSVITGDFSSAYTVKSTSHSERGPTGVARDSTTTIEAKWLGACKADQKAGDIMMPGGMKMNIKDMEKLKALIPKNLQK